MYMVVFFTSFTFITKTVSKSTISYLYSTNIEINLVAERQSWGWGEDKETVREGEDTGRIF